MNEIPIVDTSGSRGRFEAELQNITLRDRRTAFDLLEERRKSANIIGRKIARHKKPVLQQIRKVQIELNKAQRNNNTQEAENLEKKLTDLKATLEQAGRGNYSVKKEEINDKQLQTMVNSFVPSCGNWSEFVRLKNEDKNTLVKEVLSNGSDEGGLFSTSSHNLDSSYSPYLRAIRQIDQLNPFSQN